MQNLLSLIADHDVIDAMADQLIAASRSGATGAAECRGILVRFSEQFAGHDAVETRFLDEEPAVGESDAFAAAITAFKDAFPRIMTIWKAHASRWSDAAIAAEPDRFVHETSGMMALVKKRIEWEYNVLYPLALDAGHILLRPDA